MFAAAAPARNGYLASSSSVSFVDSKLEEARQKVVFPLPHVLLICHADGFYNLKGDPTCKLQLSESIKYQILFAAKAHKDAWGIAHLGENFTVQYLNVHDLVLLYRILNSYLAQDRYQNTGRGVFHRHIYEIEKRLARLCSEGPVKKEEVLAELKGSKDSTLEPLIFSITSEDPVFIQIKNSLTQWCEEKAGFPQYLDRIISKANLEEAYRKKSVSSESLDKVRQELVAAKLELVAKTKMIQSATSASETQASLLQAKVAEAQATEKELTYVRAALAKKDLMLNAALSANGTLTSSIQELEQNNEELNGALGEAQKHFKKQAQQIKQLQTKVSELTDTHAKEKAELQQQYDLLQQRISLMEVAPAQQGAIDKIMESQTRAEALIDELIKGLDSLDFKDEGKAQQTMEILVQRMAAANKQFVPSLTEKNEALRRVRSISGKTERAMDELRRKHEDERKKFEAEILVHTSRHESMSAILQGMTNELGSTQDYVKVLQAQIRSLGGFPVEIKRN